MEISTTEFTENRNKLVKALSSKKKHNKVYLLTGDAGTGKTFMAARVVDELQQKGLRALFLTVKANDTRSSLLDRGIRELKQLSQNGQAMSIAKKEADKFDQFTALLACTNTKCLVLDEFHDLLPQAANASERSKSLVFIKTLADSLDSTACLLVGLHSEIYESVKQNTQALQRCSFVRLKNFGLSSMATTKDYAAYIKGLLQATNIDPNPYMTDDFLRRALLETLGNKRLLGELVELISTTQNQLGHPLDVGTINRLIEDEKHHSAAEIAKQPDYPDLGIRGGFALSIAQVRRRLRDF